MNDLEKMAAALNASGYYHVLRHLDLCPIAEVPAGAALRTALYVDTETTGIDPKQHEIIELAMVPFRYETGSGRICHIGQAFQGYRQPKEPIPAQITALTGITGEMVAGKKIDPADLAPLIGEASIVIAHNAAFDRQFLELFCADFTAKPWACSMSQVDWAAQGYEGTKLAYLAMECGFFYDRHGALADCMAGIKLLSTELPKSGGYAMAALLAQARLPSWRIWAKGAPFEQKDALKARGYRWDGAGKVWHIDVMEAAKDEELAFLHSAVYQRQIDIPTRKISAIDRFSERAA